MSKKYDAAINALSRARISIRNEFRGSTDPRDVQEFEECSESFEAAIRLLKEAQS